MFTSSVSVDVFDPVLFEFDTSVGTDANAWCEMVQLESMYSFLASTLTSRLMPGVNTV